MDELDRFHCKMRKRSGNSLIDAVSALTPANHSDGLQIGIELQQPPGLCLLDLCLDALSDRCARDHNGLFRKIRRALREAQRHPIRKTSVDPIRLARNRIRLMDHCGDLRPPSRQDWSSGSEAPHTDNRVWTKSFEYPATSKEAFQEFGGKRHDLGRKQAR